MFSLKNSGFTIVELIVAITVLTLLTPVVIFTLGSYYEDNLNTITSSTQDADVRQAIATITNDLQNTRGFRTSFNVANTTPLGSSSGATGNGNWSYCGTGTTSTTCDGVTTDNGTTNRVLIAYNDLTDGPVNSETTNLVYIDDGKSFNLSSAVPGTFAYIYFVAPDRNNPSQNNLYRRTIVQVDPSTTAPDTYKSAGSGLRLTPFQKTSCASTVVSANSAICKANDAILLYNVKSFWIDYLDSDNAKIADYYTNNATTAATVVSNIKSNASAIEVTITKQMTTLSKKISQASGIINVNTNSASTSVTVADGSSADSAASSCQAIASTGNTADGVYWISLPTAGATQVYCLLNTVYDGGGWMLALKATRGSTFTYSSNYWTTANTLNPTAYNVSDGDAKFNSFNYFQAKDLFAIFPDMINGGSISSSTRGWTWLQNNFSSGNRTTLLSLFSGPQMFISAPSSFSGFGSQWSAQGGMTWYGINYTQNSGNSVRWGFGWNNEGDHSSNDVTGGIGVGRAAYSAGDAIYCCQTQTGINRSARVEIYVR